MKSFVFQYILRFLVTIYAYLRNLATRFPSLRPDRCSSSHCYEILLTGTFYSDNWIIPHLRPLALSRYCKRVRMVASDTVPPMDKVEAVYAPPWLTRVIGKIPARLLLFMWIALRDRPHIVGGFHMLPNGMVASLMASLTAAKSLYICGGGPREIIGGGYCSGNRIFGRLAKPDEVIERHLLDTVSSFNFVITMGSRAIDYLKQYADTSYYIVPGGFDGSRYSPSPLIPANDLVLVGRLSAIKRVDVFLQAIRLARGKIPQLSAIVVGDGPDRNMLAAMAQTLGIQQNVTFVGHQDNVEYWLRRSKIFVLTSDSEGLAQAMIQGMLCGLPAIVSDVGDLGDLVVSGINGYLVQDRTPEAFADHFVALLQDNARLAEFGNAACRTAEKYKMENVVSQWDEIFRTEQEFHTITSH